MRAKKTNWFHKKLRCDKASFLRIFKEVEASTNRLPASNGSTMDQAASVMGSRGPVQ
ncbi:hypothetical protein PC118_g17956 [Phytophthora cactorum]|uniref:Uncharacterized protein n=1 Tax=Phytophthora cactorum TaxID=29920 RepID=A0A8T1BXR9_9STRA|nr:hypothetical protein PC111_g16988 [Phytophthora cactorum]KAG2908559.1 hypothetical protein PC117_g19896 [Phytophthora cactorum]KAG2968538.1 hypothetical protein PC118_g17956 [Phytophthora cactorum]KAG2987820.1 hypothetical protein PC119_g19595 [Phytophthora cactorum]